MPARRCICRRRFSISISCRQRPGRSNTSKAVSTSRSRRTSNPCARRCGTAAILPPASSAAAKPKIDCARKSNAGLRVSLQWLRPVHGHAADGRMRRAARLSAMRAFFAARDPDRTEFLLHAIGQAQGACHQRTQRQCAEDAWRIQGLAQSELRLLLGQAVAVDEKDEEWRQELSDRATLDDQPLRCQRQSTRTNKAELSWQWMAGTSLCGAEGADQPRDRCT